MKAAQGPGDAHRRSALIRLALMAGDSRKARIQVAFNLLLIVVALIAFVAVLRDLVSSKGDLVDNLVLLVVLGALLFMGIRFLIWLIRYGLKE